MALRSKISKVVKESEMVSLRCSFPLGIAEYLGITAGDYIYWSMKTYNGKPVAIVSKEEKIEDE